MNMRATLMIMAATIAPVYAQAPIPAVNETYAALSATVQAPAASPDARAAVYPALAHIPADVEAFITLCDLSNMLKPCVKIITPTGGEMPEELLKLDSFALAIGSGSKEALNNLLKGRTSVIIAHRLSTIQGADQIIVVAEGKIAEQGTHEELLAKGGIYAHLIEMQSFA